VKSKIKPVLFSLTGAGLVCHHLEIMGTAGGVAIFTGLTDQIK
jgi:hypothetical protein